MIKKPTKGLIFRACVVLSHQLFSSKYISKYSSKDISLSENKIDYCWMLGVKSRSKTCNYFT